MVSILAWMRMLHCGKYSGIIENATLYGTFSGIEDATLCGKFSGMDENATLCSKYFSVDEDATLW